MTRASPSAAWSMTSRSTWRVGDSTTSSEESRIMPQFRIAVIGGDGIGPEVIEQAIRVADAAVRAGGNSIHWNRLSWSSALYRQTGRMMPDDGWQILSQH